MPAPEPSQGAHRGHGLARPRCPAQTSDVRGACLLLVLSLGCCNSSPASSDEAIGPGDAGRSRRGQIDGGARDSGAWTPSDAADGSESRDGKSARDAAACAAAYGGSWAHEFEPPAPLIVHLDDENTSYSGGAYLPGGVAVHDGGAITIALADTGRWESLLVRLDARGNELWKRRVEGATYGLAVAPAGGVVATGTLGSTNLDGDAFVTKLGGDGEPEWTTALGADGRDWIGRHVLVDDAGAWVFGEERWIYDVVIPNPPVGNRPFLARLSPDGQLEWRQTLGDDRISLRGVAAGRDGGAVIGVRLDGASLEVAGSRYERAYGATLLIAFDRTGTALWSRNLGAWDEDRVWVESLADGPDGTLYMTGNRWRLGPGNVSASSTLVTATTPEARVLWTSEVAEGIQMSGSTLAPDPCGGSTLSAHYDDIGTYGLLLVALDANGAEKRRLRIETDRDVGGIFASQVAAHGGGGLVILANFAGEVDLGPARLGAAGIDGTFVARLAEDAWP